MVGDRLGGHFVTGHIDGLGRWPSGATMVIGQLAGSTAPAGLVRQSAPKGSIAIDGVSLTVVNVREDRFSVALIPHTLEVTTLGRLTVGDAVNLETDVLAKYVARLQATDDKLQG